MSRVSIKKSMLFFHERALPRRTRDSKAEELHFKKTKKHKNIYRRVGPDEHDRGELYPLLHSGMDTFAHFGVGIGIYFAQLVILTCVTFLCGMVMLAAVNEYQKPSYGASPLIPFSAACEAKNVTATVGCPFGEAECVRSFRSCELPYTAAAADIAMCIIFCIAIIFSKYIEAKIEQKLDESVQTAKDYSVEVLDPDGTADDPTRWFNYFSQFGDVKYITILRRNNELTDLILKKHYVVRKIQESGRMISQQKTESLHQQYEKIEEEINRALKKVYPVCKVFVTFDSEKDQHQCLNELEVADYQAIFDFKSKTANSSYFFGDNVLDIRQPPEPDNILWQNLAVGRFQARSRNVLAFCAYVGILAIVWYLVQAVRDNVPNLLGLLVGIVDSVLPTIFDAITDYQNPRSEGGKQTSLQTRLFCARFLLSTIIPYLTAEWNAVITPEFIGQILAVQIAACFTAPLMDLTDWYGLTMRHYYSSVVADTQEEMNSFWVGSYWSIAEKYTGIAKVVFVSLFYALLTPISLLIATVAFIVIFFIDNYLLLRRWKVASMLDSTIASRLRRQAILSICAHMFVTMRFIYSWPMDEVYWNGTAYEIVDKQPPYNFLTVQIQPWMSEGQKHIFYSYKVLLIIVCLTTLHILILQPFGQWLFLFWCKSIRVAGEVDSMKFSSVESIRIYYPMLRFQEAQYLCSYAKNVLPRHRPVLIDSNNIMKDDLSVYIPVEDQKRVLSIVQYFGIDPIVQYEEKKIIDGDDLQTVASKSLPKPKSKKVFAVSFQESFNSALYQARLCFWRQQDYLWFRWSGQHIPKPAYLVPPPPSRHKSTRTSMIVPTCETPDELARMADTSDLDLEMSGSGKMGGQTRNSRTPTPTKDFRSLVRRLNEEQDHQLVPISTSAGNAPIILHSNSNNTGNPADNNNSNSQLSPAAMSALKAFRTSANSSPAAAAFKKAILAAKASSSGSPSAISPAGVDARNKSFFPTTASDNPERKTADPLEEKGEDAAHLRARFGIIPEEEEDDSSTKLSPKKPSLSASLSTIKATQPSENVSASDAKPTEDRNDDKKDQISEEAKPSQSDSKAEQKPETNVHTLKDVIIPHEEKAVATSSFPMVIVKPTAGPAGANGSSKPLIDFVHSPEPSSPIVMSFAPQQDSPFVAVNATSQPKNLSDLLNAVAAAAGRKEEKSINDSINTSVPVLATTTAPADPVVAEISPSFAPKQASSPQLSSRNKPNDKHEEQNHDHASMESSTLPLLASAVVASSAHNSPNQKTSTGDTAQLENKTDNDALNIDLDNDDTLDLEI